MGFYYTFSVKLLVDLNQTWSPTYEPVAVQDGGSVFPIHEYTLPTTGMFKVEVWIHIITRVAEKPKMYLNFGYGYFYSDFSRPEPIIKGGTERTVPSNAVLVLDGTNSYGTTLPRLKDKRLMYIWSCNLTTLECADKETKDTFFKPNIRLLPGMVIKFTLSVYYLPLQYMPDEAFTSTQIIRVAEKNVSEVLIICFCNCITEYFGVNPDEYFCLRASKLITSDDEKWDWKCYDKNTNTYLNIDEIREPDRDSSELVIKGGKLKQNRMYLFSVEDLSSSPGRAEMLITVDTQSVVNIRLYVTQTDSTGIYHKIFARGFYNLTKSHFAIYCEFFHKANSDNESDVMFAFNTGCLVKKAVLITGRIYVRFCDSRGSCSIKEGQVNLDVYFFRDIYQIASIFVKCFAKRHELNHTNSTINIFLLRSAAEFLRKISMKIKTDVKTTFLNQVDHSENDYRNVGL
ncbi:uncharacterized protein LOC142327962 [Lycorma delicatula]|uniref:uncharacterized protein LOC142327962 n=1 Tax=Lycorma delicatula TaxID=130591 RepID=UPI003F50F1E2